MDIYSEIVRLRRAGEKCALATIVGARGSVPSYESAKLLVRADGSIFGTVGGGCVEAQVLTAAREVIETGRSKTLTFELTQDAAHESGLICGGEVEIFVEPVLPQPAGVHLWRRTHLQELVENRQPGGLLHRDRRRPGVFRQPRAVSGSR